MCWLLVCVCVGGVGGLCLQIVEAVEEEGDGFKFTFEDSGQLGRPIIQMEGVTFGYGVSAACLRVRLVV
jgi:hypothetical protein